MLINSSSVKGKCLICGAASCACGGPTTVIPVDERMQRAAGSGGRMVRIEVDPSRGVGVQITEAEAIRRGLIPRKPEPAAQPKKMPAADNKKRSPGGNKGG